MVQVHRRERSRELPAHGGIVCGDSEVALPGQYGNEPPRSSAGSVPALSANRLPAALPRKGRQRSLAGSEPVHLVFGEVLAETGERIRHVGHPTESYVSLVMPIDGCTSMAAGLAGDDGTLGISFILGVGTSSLKALVRISGAAPSIEAAPIRRELEQNLALRRRQVAKVPLLRLPESPFGGGDQWVHRCDGAA